MLVFLNEQFYLTLMNAHLKTYFQNKSGLFKIEKCWIFLLFSFNLKYCRRVLSCSFFQILDSFLFTAGASSQYYWYKLMLLKCQINTNTNINGFPLPTKCLEGALQYSYLVSIILNLLFMFAFTIIRNEEW